MKLTDTTIRAAKPAEKPWKLFDGRGLFVLVNPDGSRWWRFKYRYGGKERLLALGTYPEVKLKEAREAHERARKQQQSSTVRRQPRSLVAVHSTS